MTKRILAIVAGILSAGIVLMALESLGHLIVPPPIGVNYNNPAELTAAMSKMPAISLWFVIIAWVIGNGIGCTVAYFMNPKGATVSISVVTILMLAGIAVNATNVPHPPWMLTIGAVGVIGSALVVWWYTKRKSM